MSDIDRFRPEDRRGVDTLYRRMHGADAAEATRLRWDWQHRRNPHNATGQPGIWVAREGPTVVGHYPDAARPPLAEGARGRRRVGHRRDGRARARSPGSRRSARARLGSQQRRGAGARASRTRRVRCSIGCTGPSRTSCRALVKPLTRRAVRLPHLPTPLNRLISAVTHPLVQIVARSRPLRAECEPIRRFDHAFTALWERLAPKFDLAVRRDARI